MSLASSIKSGFLGTVALNVIHESARKLIPDAPRMDQVAMNGIEKVLEPTGYELSETNLRRAALAGDMVANTLFYAALTRVAERSSRTGKWGWAAAFGLAAGLGAVYLPEKLGLQNKRRRKNPVTAGLTVAWYLAGALIAVRGVEKRKQLLH